MTSFTNGRPAEGRARLMLLENSIHRTGAFASALALATAIRDSHEVEFVLPSRSMLHEQVVSAGFVCHDLPMVEIGWSFRKLAAYLPMLMINVFRLRRLLLRRDIDVLVVNDYYNLLGAGVRVLRWQGVLLTMVRLMPANQNAWVNRLWTLLGMMFSTHVIAVSQAVARQLPANPKVKVAYNSIRMPNKHPFSLTRLGAEDGLVYCLYPANYIAGKGHEVALEAFSVAWRVNPSLRLRFVGGDMGLEKNRELKSQLIRVTEFMKLQHVVSIEGFSEDLEHDIKQSDIVLNFSRSESFSITCTEASAYGRPIIATRCGGPEEIIDEGVSGLLVPVDDVDAMSQAILKLAGGPDLRRRMGAEGVRIVSERFLESAFVDRFLPLCRAEGT